MVGVDSRISNKFDKEKLLEEAAGVLAQVLIATVEERNLRRKHKKHGLQKDSDDLSRGNSKDRLR